MQPEVQTNNSLSHHQEVTTTSQSLHSTARQLECYDMRNTPTEHYQTPITNNNVNDSTVLVSLIIFVFATEVIILSWIYGSDIRRFLCRRRRRNTRNAKDRSVEESAVFNGKRVCGTEHSGSATQLIIGLPTQPLATHSTSNLVSSPLRSSFNIESLEAGSSSPKTGR